MTKKPDNTSPDEKDSNEEAATGYHLGSVDTLISVEDVVREVEKMSSDVSKDDVAALAHKDPFLRIDNLKAVMAKWKSCMISICRSVAASPCV